MRFYQNTLIAILFAGSVVQSGAQYTLYSPNGQSSLLINLSGSSSGLSDWQVGGASQLNQQWFYYSIGSSPVYSIDQIASPSSVNNHGGAAPFLSAVYSNSTISVTAKFQLNNLPTLTDTITILNPAIRGRPRISISTNTRILIWGAFPGARAFNSAATVPEYHTKSTRPA